MTKDIDIPACSFLRIYAKGALGCPSIPPSQSNHQRLGNSNSVLQVACVWSLLGYPFATLWLFCAVLLHTYTTDRVGTKGMAGKDTFVFVGTSEGLHRVAVPSGEPCSLHHSLHLLAHPAVSNCACLSLPRRRVRSDRPIPLLLLLFLPLLPLASSHVQGSGGAWGSRASRSTVCSMQRKATCCTQRLGHRQHGVTA